MKVEAFETMISILERLKTEYEKESAIYKMNLSIVDRAKQKAQTAHEDLAFIYSEVDQFKTLLPQILIEIQRYQTDQSFFKSKKQINEFITTFREYAVFFQSIMQHLADAAKEIDVTEDSARRDIAATSMFLDLDQLTKRNRITTVRNDAVLVLAHIMIQKKSFYVFSKVAVISYDMIEKLANTCQPVKKKRVLSPNKHYYCLDTWTDKYDREISSHNEVSTHIAHHTLSDLKKNLDSLRRYNAGEMRKSPIERYTKENRLRITAEKPTATQQTRSVSSRDINPRTSVFVSSEYSDDTVVENKLKVYSEKFQTIFTQLKRKTEQLSSQSNPASIDYDERYKKVGLAAENLVNALDIAQKEFFCSANGKINLSKVKVEAFTQACYTAIQTAEKEFKNHRHLWGQLDLVLKGILGILALITVLPALIVSIQSKHGYMGTFFVQQPTDSWVQLKRFESDFEQQIEREFYISLGY